MQRFALIGEDNVIQMPGPQGRKFFFDPFLGHQPHVTAGDQRDHRFAGQGFRLLRIEKGGDW